MKTNPEGWGAVIDGVHVTCCNLNGPMGLAYLPYVAVMNSGTGPVINLYNAVHGHGLDARRASRCGCTLQTDYPKTG